MNDAFLAIDIATTAGRTGVCVRTSHETSCDGCELGAQTDESKTRPDSVLPLHNVFSTFLRPHFLFADLSSDGDGICGGSCMSVDPSADCELLLLAAF
jgi:hypothetical protein